MKKLIFSTLFLLMAVCMQAHEKKSYILLLPDIYQNVTKTATLKSSSRLFATKDNLTSVILIIPSGSIVSVIDSDSTYLHVTFEENEGFIFSRDAVMDKTPANFSQAIKPQPTIQQDQPQQVQQNSRYSSLESKYGSAMAARLIAGKIWKGMNAEMVKDSWGSAEKINRAINGNIVKEEWIFKTTWLYFENNILVEWGPVKK